MSDSWGSSDRLITIPMTQIVGTVPPDPASQKPSTYTEVEMTAKNVPLTTNGRRRSFHVVSIDEDDVVRRSPTAAHKKGNSDIVVATIAERGRQFSKRYTRRLVQKSGECNVTSIGITKRRRMYLADMFTTLVEMRWSYHAVLFTTQFMVTWVLFGTVYYAIAVGRGDIANAHNETWAPCVIHIYDYTSAVMFSMETHTTIGYGVRVPDPDCKIGMFVVMIQSCIGTFIQVLATGIVFAKISRPKGRAKTLMFSRNAVICLRDGQYQLMFRVGDMRHKSHIIGTSIRALMVRNRLTAEGELIPMCQYPLSLDNETSPVDDIFLFMVWPVTVVHTIDQSSPLWDISAEQLITEQFEIIVILEGTIESSGSSTQVRTSYLPSEIEWGQRLAPLVTYHKENGCYTIDYKRFHDTLPFLMPDFSAKHWSTYSNTSTLRHLAATTVYHADFTTNLFEPNKQDRRLISKIFRRGGMSGATGVQRQLHRTPRTEKNDRADQDLVWTVADPSNPAATLTRHLPPLWLDVECNENIGQSADLPLNHSGWFLTLRVRIADIFL